MNIAKHSVNYLKLKHKLKNEIINAIQFGYNHFITGMALGTDILCAKIVLKLKKKHDIKLECAIPCLNQTERWTNSDKKNYEIIINQADIKTYVSDKKYYNGCMQKRNRYMVDNSSLIIAHFNGSTGGTKQTIDYAKSKNKKIIIIE